jgi:hypothetical protein
VRLFLYCLSFIGILFSQSQRVIALRVEFLEDHSEFTTGNGRFDLRETMPIDSIQSIAIDPPPHNKSYFEDHLLFAKNYFLKTLSVTLDYSVFPSGENDAFQLSKAMYYYNPNTKEDSLKGIVELYTESYALAEQAGITILPNDIVIIFHAGVGNDIYKEVNYTPHDIPSLSLSASLFNKYNASWNNASRSIKGIILPETSAQEGLELAINGLVVANIGTQLGLLDLVDPSEQTTVVGPWALEDRGLFNAGGLLPAAPSVVNRLYFSSKLDSLKASPANGSLLPITYAGNTNSSAKDVHKIKLNGSEYLLVEQRYRDVYNADRKLNLDELISELTPVNSAFYNYKQVLKDANFSHRDDFTFSPRGVLIDAKNFDAALPHSGIAIWHIDDKILKEKAAENSINNDAVYRGVRFLEADGVDNYSTGGDGFNDERLDVFYAENDAAYYQNKIDGNTFPSTNSNYEFAKSGLVLDQFSSLAEEMSFRASRSENIQLTEFKRPVQVMYRHGTRIHGFAIDADSLSILERAHGNNYFTVESYAHALGAVDAAYLEQDSILVYFKDSRAYRYNFISETELFSGHYEPKVKRILYSNREFYYQDIWDQIGRVGENFVSISSDLGKTYFYKNQLHVIQGEKRIYEFYNNQTTYTNLQGDGIIELNGKEYGTEINVNRLTAMHETGAIIEGFPKDIPYRNQNETLVHIQPFAEHLLTIDDKNIIKITALNPVNQNNLSIYTGFKPSFIDITYSASANEATFLFGDSIYFREETRSLPANREIAAPEALTGVLNKKHSYLWPNPSKDGLMNLRLTATKAAKAQIRIFTENGFLKKTFSAQSAAGLPVDIALPISDLANGTYFILVKIGNESQRLKATVIH